MRRRHIGEYSLLYTLLFHNIEVRANIRVIVWEILGEGRLIPPST